MHACVADVKLLCYGSALDDNDILPLITTCGHELIVYNDKNNPTLIIYNLCYKKKLFLKN